MCYRQEGGWLCNSILLMDRDEMEGGGPLPSHLWRSMFVCSAPRELVPDALFWETVELHFALG